MRSIRWFPGAWEEYLELQSNQALLKKINRLIKDVQRNGYNASYGKIEILKGQLSGMASVRIDKKNRLVFAISDDTLDIILCGNHYNDK